MKLIKNMNELLKQLNNLEEVISKFKNEQQFERIYSDLKPPINIFLNQKS